MDWTRPWTGKGSSLGRPLHMASFKRCTKCGVKIPTSDGHDKCILCLGETHIPGACTHCRAMTSQALKNRDQKLKASLYDKVFQTGASGEPAQSTAASASTQAEKVNKPSKRKHGDKQKSSRSSKSDQDSRRARSASPPPKTQHKGPPSTVSVPPPVSRPTATPIPEVVSSSVPPSLEPRILISSHLSVPDKDLQIVDLDQSSESEGEIPDSDAPLSPQRQRQASPWRQRCASQSPSRPRLRCTSPQQRDRAALETEADEALVIDPVHRHHSDRDRDQPDRALFDTYPDLIYDHHTGQYCTSFQSTRAIYGATCRARPE